MDQSNNKDQQKQEKEVTKDTSSQSPQVTEKAKEEVIDVKDSVEGKPIEGVKATPVVEEKPLEEVKEKPKAKVEAKTKKKKAKSAEVLLGELREARSAVNRLHAEYHGALAIEMEQSIAQKSKASKKSKK